MKGQDGVLKQHVFHLCSEAGLHLIHSGQILYLSCSKRSPGTMLGNPLCHLPVSRILVSIATLYPECCNFSANYWLIMLLVILWATAYQAPPSNLAWDFPGKSTGVGNYWLIMLVIVCPVDLRLRSNSTLSGFVIHRLRK